MKTPYIVTAIIALLLIIILNFISSVACHLTENGIEIFKQKVMENNPQSYESTMPESEIRQMLEPYIAGMDIPADDMDDIYEDLSTMSPAAVMDGIEELLTRSIRRFFAWIQIAVIALAALVILLYYRHYKNREGKPTPGIRFGEGV